MPIFGFDSVKDMFDGGGRGGSGTEHSFKSHDDYKKDYEREHSKSDDKAQSHNVSGSFGNDDPSPITPSSYPTGDGISDENEIGIIGTIGGLISDGISLVVEIAGGAKTRALRFADSLGNAIGFGSSATEQISDGDLTDHDLFQATGGLAGGSAGLAGGAALGTLVFPFVGTFVGGMIGGYLGGKGGSKFGEIVSEFLGDNTDTVATQVHSEGTEDELVQTFSQHGQDWVDGERVDIIRVEQMGPEGPDVWYYPVPHGDAQKEIDRLNSEPSAVAPSNRSDDNSDGVIIDIGGALASLGDAVSERDWSFSEEFGSLEDSILRTFSQRVANLVQDPGSYLTGVQPIIFDLDGNGIQIIELSNSSIYMDATGDGLKNKTAWADVGNAVLFLDLNGDGTITEARQYIFTEWDPTAKSDFEALASVFDTNGDGVLSGDELSQFKLMVTQADGSLVAMSFADLGITSLDLNVDATQIELPDGSVITGQATFTRDDGSTGTAADVTLTAEANGYRVEQVEMIDGSGQRTEVTTGYMADGSIAFVNTTVVSADGASTANSYDDNGDGVIDRLQTIDIVTNPDGATVKTVTNSVGATAATAILLNQTVTTTSADGNTVTIQRDSTGGGWFDQTEVRITAPDGSMSIVTTDIAQDGTVIRSIDEAVSADGLTRTEAIDQDGDGLVDMTLDFVIVVNPDGSRSETTTVTNPDGTVRSVSTETVSADGQTRTISSDVDGDGNIDTIQSTDIDTSGAGSVSTIDVTNGDGTARTSTTVTQSDDALTKTVAADLDGDGIADVTTTESTVINPDDSRVTTTTVTNADGTLRSMSEVTLGADKVTSQTHVDLNQDGTFDATDLVQSVSVNGTTGDRTATTWDRNADGSINGVTTSVTSADGLTRTTTIDADGDSDTNGDGIVDTPTAFDTKIEDETTIDANGQAIRTIKTTNQDGSVRSTVTETTSADGLITTTEVDSDGDGLLDRVTVESQSVDGAGIVVRTSSTYAGDETTLLSQSVSTQSADRRETTTEIDGNGDGSIDRTVVTIVSEYGERSITETTFHSDGTIAAQTTSVKSNDGLYSEVSSDSDGDGVIETTTTSLTVLSSNEEDHLPIRNSLPETGGQQPYSLVTSDGGQTEYVKVFNNDWSIRSETKTLISDDGLSTTTFVDADGADGIERTQTSDTTLGLDGSTSTLSQTFAANGDLLTRSQSEVNDDGLIVTQSTDADGNGSFDLIETRTTTLEADGDTTTVTELRDASGDLRSSSTSTVSDDGRDTTRSIDTNGDGNADQVTSASEADDGTLTSTTTQLNADGSTQSSSQTVVSANGLNTTVTEDRDGDGIADLIMTEETTLNADGSVTEVLADRDRENDVYSISTVTTSDDGRTVTRTNDYDADGINDLTVVSQTDLSLTGVQTQTTTRTSADGATIGVLRVETSADGRTVTTNNDTDGNGFDDLRTTSVITDTGARDTTTEFRSSGGVVESSLEVNVSADGRTVTRSIDRNGDGEIDRRTVETTAVDVDGTLTESVEHRDKHNQLEGSEEHTVSDDGMSSQSILDLDGNGVLDFNTETQTVFADNGDIVERMVTQDVTSDTLSEITTVTSGDGLNTSVEADYSGDGSIDRSTVIVRGADGGFTRTEEQFGAGYVLQQVTTDTQSADGRSSQREVDLNGDGFVDQRIQTEIDLSGNTTVVHEDVSTNGVVTGRITTTQSANGMASRQAFDVNADGVADITRATNVSYGDDGEMITSFTESFGSGAAAYAETRTVSADGLTSTTTFDADGDGDIDGTSVTETILNEDGSRTTTSQTLLADGELHSSSTETVSADGRTTTREVDYDGNGIADKTSETVVASDGSSVTTESSFNEIGELNNNFITSTSADGLTTTVLRQGNVQTTTKSVLNNGSYDWNNGVSSGTHGHSKTSHEVDALGVETWSLTFTEGTVTSSVEVRLDAQAKAQLLEEAESIFDAVLDRGLDTKEREELIRWVEDGQLDKLVLIQELMGSGEFATRYGTMSDAEFITQMHLNCFGHAPSMHELGSQLTWLSWSSYSREDLVLMLADSVAHDVVGNAHMRTNNFDVIMNPAVFERSLDRPYIEALVTDIVDVVYDREPTAHELAYLTDLLLDGTERPDDIANMLLGEDGAIHGVNYASLNGLSGSAFVEQAFMNALGRPATQQEIDLWTDKLADGSLTNAQFVASLAQSGEMQEFGNLYSATNAPSTNVVTNTAGPTGSSGSNTYEGGTGIDFYEGSTADATLDGNNGSDVYEWSKGDGNDRIDEEAEKALQTDTLLLSDTLPNEITLTRTDDHLIITVASTGETIRVDDQYDVDDPWRGIELIQFADGSEWTVDDIHANTNVNGTSGNNSLNGTIHADNLFGEEGNDTLTGRNGDDQLDGGTGIDVLRGGNGSDTYVWSLGDGNDQIDETNAFTSDGLKDVDTLKLQGINSSEVRLVRDGSSLDQKNDLWVVIDTPDGEVWLGIWDQFDDAGEGIEKIEFSGDGVVWTLNDIIENAKFEGDDGNNTISGIDKADDQIYGGAGDDTLSGGEGHDMLVGGQDNDTLKGGLGSDTYVWSIGDGDDTIDERSGSNATDFDRLILTDVNSDQVTLRRSLGDSDDLLIEISSDSGVETIKVVDDVSAGNSYLELIIFADGVQWTGEDILSRTKLIGRGNSNPAWAQHIFDDDTIDGSNIRDNIYGRSGNDTIDGKAGDDWLYGGEDDDTLIGGAGNDTYVYMLGDGNDLIIDTSDTDVENDTLVFADLGSGDVTLKRSGIDEDGDDLIVTVNATGETITIQDRFDVPAPISGISNFNESRTGSGVGIEYIRFRDGVVIEILGGPLAETITTDSAGSSSWFHGSGLNDTFYGLDGNDTIRAYTGDDTLEGGTGNDVLRGDQGNDTYIWSKGDGNDVIEDREANTSETDVLKLLDVASDDVALIRPEGTNNLVIRILSTGEIITIDDSYDADHVGRGIEAIVFSDGQTWSLDDIRNKTVTEDSVGGTAVSGTRYDDNLFGLDGNDTITAGQGDDTLVGGIGADTLVGGSGNDTYIWYYGDGDDDIDDRPSTAAQHTDTLVLGDVLSSDVSLYRPTSGTGKTDNLFIAIQGPSGVATIDVYDQFVDQGDGIERIIFEDGEVWTLQDIISKTTHSGTETANTLNGRSGVDNIFGLDGNDTIDGKAGNDRLYGEEGDDRLEGDTGDDMLYGGAGIDALFGEVGDDLLFGGTGNDTLNGGTGDDALRGGADDDQLDGGAGADAYIWSRGDGNDVINDTGTNVLEHDYLVFDDVNSTEVSVSMTMSGSMIITIPGENGGTVEMPGQFSGAPTGIERVTFADGVIWNSNDLLAALGLDGSNADDQLVGTPMDDMLVGGAGIDMLFGSDGNDVIAGGAGNGDLLRGGLGDDTYVFNRGDGKDTIDESSFTVTEGGVTTIQYDDEGLSSKYNPPMGKDGFASYSWIHDTRSNAYINAREGGFDAVQFGSDIGIADLIVTTETIADELGRDPTLQTDMYINFVENDGTISQQDALTITNAGDNEFSVDQLNFETGYSIDLLTFPFNLIGNNFFSGIAGDETDNILTTSGGWVTGLAGNDAIVGLADYRDFINGGSGDDVMTGGLSTNKDLYLSDYFIFNEDDGNDVITDFELGHDIIVFDIAGMTFDDLTIETGHAGAVVRYDGDDSITFNGVTVAQLTEDHFEFA